MASRTQSWMSAGEDVIPNMSFASGDRPPSRGGSRQRAPSAGGNSRPTTPADKSMTTINEQKGATPLRGPERFFYDRSTYTGCHSRGGSKESSGTYHLTLLSKQAELAETAIPARNGSKEPPGFPKAAGDDRARIECTTCGYKCTPQWLNDEAHCLKCWAVLWLKPSVHQRDTPVRPSSRGSSGGRKEPGAVGPLPGALQLCRDASAVLHRKGSATQKCDSRQRSDYSSGGRTSPADRASLRTRSLSRSGSKDQVSRSGPERFFYDKSTYTGTHLRGGPDSVAKGGGTCADQSWKRTSP